MKKSSKKKKKVEPKLLKHKLVETLSLCTKRWAQNNRRCLLRMIGEKSERERGARIDEGGAVSKMLSSR